MTLTQQVASLAASMDKLGDSDQRFAASLCQQFRSRGLSLKQAEWISRLLERATTPQPVAQPVASLAL